MKLRPPILTTARSLQLYQLLRFGALFLISIAIAHFIGSRQLIGQYEKLLLIGGSFTFFWVSGIINAFIPRYKASSEEDKPALIFNVFLLLSGISLLVFAVLHLCKPLLFNGPDDYFRYYILFSLFGAPAFLLEYILLVRGWPKALFWYGVGSAALQFLSMALPLGLHYFQHDHTAYLWQISLGDALYCLMFTGILRYIVLAVLVFVQKGNRLSLAIALPFIRKASPLIVSLLLGGSMAYVDSYMVDYFFSAGDFALYQYGARELPLVMLMANALSNVLSGDIAEAHKETRMPHSLSRLRSSSLKLMHLLYPLTMLLMLGSRFLYAKVYGAGFAAAAPIFNIYLLLIMSRLVFPQTVLLGMQAGRQLLLSSLAETILNIALNLLFLKYFGLAGIAYATVIAYLAEKAMQAVILYRKGIKPAEYVPARAWLMYNAATLLIFLLSQAFL